MGVDLRMLRLVGGERIDFLNEQVIIFISIYIHFLVHIYIYIFVLKFICLFAIPGTQTTLVLLGKGRIFRG